MPSSRKSLARRPKQPKTRKTKRSIRPTARDKATYQRALTLLSDLRRGVGSYSELLRKHGLRGRTARKYLGRDLLGGTRGKPVRASKADRRVRELMFPKPGNLRRASEQWMAGGLDVSRAFKEMKARGRETELKALRRWLFDHHVGAVNTVMQDANEKIAVWSAVARAFDSYVRHAALVRVGVEALSEWWSAVEKRVPKDFQAKKLMKIQLRKLDAMMSEIVAQERPDQSLIGYLNRTQPTLQRRVNDYLDAVAAS